MSRRGRSPALWYALKAEASLMQTPDGDGRRIFSVVELNRGARVLLEQHFPRVWVEGEISNLACPASGHLYFTLKDDQAQVRCAMFRNRKNLLRFAPANGEQILVRARLSLYEPRGDYQLVVEHMEQAGHGALQRAFEALRDKLQRDGLFDTAHKRPLPAFPRRIGVITSPTGAALKDVLSVLARRYACAQVLIYPTAVQGDHAPMEIVRQLERAGDRRDCDLLLLTRGGGSLEDLWAFNDERVARAVFDCPVPVVAAVGHEVDFTIVEFVADLRAPTPSAAAEHAVPNAADLLRALITQRTRMESGVGTQLRARRMGVQALESRLRQQHPGRRLAQHAQRLDELEQRMTRAWLSGLQQRGQQLHNARIRTLRASPRRRLALDHERLAILGRRLRVSMGTMKQGRQAALNSAARALESVSPLATLQRGYAIARTYPQGAVIRRAEQAPPGSRIETLLGEGRLICLVEQDPENT